jgi:hypothetical protein
VVIADAAACARHIVDVALGAVPIYGDMTKFLELQPRGSECLFAGGSPPIKDFRESWDQACKLTGQSDTQEAGRLADKFLAREHENLAQNTSQNAERPN